MKKTNLLFSVLMIAALSSCTKDEDPKETIPDPTTDLVIAPYIPNPANPYDGAGARHNSALDSLLKQNFRNPGSRDELFRKTMEFFGREYPTYSYNSFYLPIKTFLDSVHTTDIIATPLERRGLNPRATPYVLRLLDSIKSARNDMDFARGAKIIEAEAISTFSRKNTLDSITVAQVLTAASVFRYSACYWHHNLSEWNKSKKLANPGADTTTYWASVAKEDGKGAVAGAVGGSLAGPKGTIIGGFLGGIGSSLASWIFD